MNLTIAQVKYAYFKLMGKKIGETFQKEANDMYFQFGEARIREALKDFNAEDYKAGKYDFL